MRLQQNLTVKSKARSGARRDINNMTTPSPPSRSGATVGVGVEGRLGGQANVPGAPARGRFTGTSTVAANLTTQCGHRQWRRRSPRRLTRSIQVMRGRGRRAQRQHQTDDRQSALPPPKTRAGLVKTTCALYQHAAGPGDLENVGRMLLSAGAAVTRRTGHLPVETRRRRASSCSRLCDERLSVTPAPAIGELMGSAPRCPRICDRLPSNVVPIRSGCQGPAKNFLSS